MMQSRSHKLNLLHNFISIHAVQDSDGCVEILEMQKRCRLCGWSKLQTPLRSGSFVYSAGVNDHIISLQRWPILCVIESALCCSGILPLLTLIRSIVFIGRQLVPSPAPVASDSSLVVMIMMILVGLAKFYILFFVFHKNRSV